MDYKRACVLGGTGFLGRQVVRELARLGYTVKVATRLPESAYFLKPCGSVGQIVPYFCNYRDEAALRDAVKGCQVVVNCIGILYEKKRGDFQRIHAELPRQLGIACKAEGVERLVHISALGVDNAQSRYAKTKLTGEKNILNAFPGAVILRPSVMFGMEDNFFNMFAKLAKFLPFLPLIGGGKTRFQPVYVGDVADAAMAAAHETGAKGRIYELGGPEIMDFREIYGRIFAVTRQSRPLISIPFWMARIQGSIMGMMPSPMLTADQVESLKTDNIVQSGMPGLSDLAIQPTGVDAILPSYLERFRPGGRFGDKQRA